MRVLLSTFGSRGDVEPVAALAAALVARGAAVRMAAPPDEEFRRLAEGAGAEFAPVGRSAKAAIAGKLPPKSSAPAIAAELVAGRFDGLDAIAGDCDAMLATGMFPAGAREVAERHGIPYRFSSPVPGVLPSPHHPPHARPGRPIPPDADDETGWRIDAENLNALYGTPLNERRAALGLEPVADVRSHVYTDRPWLAADQVLAPWIPTDRLDVVQTGAWVLPDERALPADLEAFLDGGEPPVYVGFGSMPMADREAAAQAAVDAVRAHGRRIVLSSGWAGLAAAGGADCFAAGEVNHRALFARCAAVVHHGGAGTTATAARAGAPQVVVPQIADQPYWAGRVAALGIGAAHDGRVFTVESLSAALGTALEGAAAERARDVASRMRTDGADVAARLLVDAV